MRLFTSLSPTLPVQLRFPPYLRLPLALSPLSVLRYHAWVRYLTGLALVVFLFAVFATSVTANGGMLVHREQQGGYDIAVTVWPPEPKTGLLVFTVLIQAVAATNGGDEAHLAPISSDLILRGEGPFGYDGGAFPTSDRAAGIQPLRRSHSRGSGRAVDVHTRRLRTPWKRFDERPARGLAGRRQPLADVAHHRSLGGGCTGLRWSPGGVLPANSTLIRHSRRVNKGA